MDAPERPSDAELLRQFRVDYLHALELEDYLRINSIIVPQFWEHFAKYYYQYEKSWKDLSIASLPIRVMINPVEKRQAEIVWIEKVLKGQIGLIP
jgi:hypothetical protein